MFLKKMKNSLRELFLAPLKKKKPKHYYCLAELLFLTLKVKYGVHGSGKYRGFNHMKYFSADIVCEERHYHIHETHGAYGERMFSISKKGVGSLFSVHSIPVFGNKNRHTEMVSTLSQQLCLEKDLYEAIVSLFIKAEKSHLLILPSVVEKGILFDFSKSWELFQKQLPPEAA